MSGDGTSPGGDRKKWIGIMARHAARGFFGRNLLATLWIVAGATGPVMAAEPKLFEAPDLMSTAPALVSPDLSGTADIRSGTNGAKAPQKKVDTGKPLNPNISVSPQKSPSPPIGLSNTPELTVPPLDAMSAGAPYLTTGSDVARDVRKIQREQAEATRKKREAEAAIKSSLGVKGQLSPENAGKKTVVVNSHESFGAQPSDDSGTPSGTVHEPPDSHDNHAVGPTPAPCQPRDSLNSMLSAKCIETMKVLESANLTGPSREPAVNIGTEIPASTPPSRVQCGVIIFMERGGATVPTSFTTESVKQCIEMSTHMSYGIPGVTNITAADPRIGTVAVTCRRAQPDGEHIECSAQEQ